VGMGGHRSLLMVMVWVWVQIRRKMLGSNMNLWKTSRFTSTLVCKACMEGKQYTAKLGNDAKKQVTKPLKIVHLDVCGPIKNMSMGGAKYFVIIVDNFLGMFRFT
jgi:hypothetical protein